MAVSAPVLDAAGKPARELELDEAVFAAEVRPHLVHETVRAEMAAARAATRGGKSRGMVSGGRSKPWRQKGTGRARQGSTRAPQWTGGGMAFPPSGRNFELKVNRKARKAAFRAALTSHAALGSLAVVDGSSFGTEPSTKSAAAFVASWSRPRPLVVVATPEEQVLAKSFRNLPGVLVLEPAALEVGALVWARSLLVTEAALAHVLRVAR